MTFSFFEQPFSYIEIRFSYVKEENRAACVNASAWAIVIYPEG